MNIIVIGPDGSVSTRPDSTLMRRPQDFFLPEDLGSVTARTCLYIKMTKAGKAIRREFARRYFDSVGKGVLLTCDGGITHIDWSTYIFEGQTPSGEIDSGLLNTICEGLERATRHISVRQSDIVAFENDDPVTLRRGDAYSPWPSLEFNIR